MKILCAGDLHLGRRPSRLGEGVDGRRFSAAAVWDAIVDCAVEGQVDAVALTGDLVDRDNRFYEALGPLEGGLRKLAQADIDTFAVAGNHDFDVLGRLARSLDSPRFHLLGQAGRWQQVVLDRPGRTPVRFAGWSFPGEHVRSDPLAGCDLPPGDAPVVVLLHTDVDQPTSPYAPVAMADLLARPVAAWLLGHVHQPRLHGAAGRPLVLYPGSPQPLDPGEPGPHGAWLIELDSAGRAQARMIPLASVRYERIELDLTGVDERDELDRRLPEAIRQRLAQAVADGGPLERLCCRLVLSGRTKLYHALKQDLPERLRELGLAHGPVTATVEKIIDQTQPPADLDELARGSDPPGLLARLILSLRSGADSPEASGLIRSAQQKLAQVRSNRCYAALSMAEAGGPAADDPPAADLLVRQGLLLLDALLAQKESA